MNYFNLDSAERKPLKVPRNRAPGVASQFPSSYGSREGGSLGYMVGTSTAPSERPHAPVYGIAIIGAFGLLKIILAGASLATLIVSVAALLVFLLPFAAGGRPIVPLRNYKGVAGEVLAWILLSAGIAVRQLIDLDQVNFRHVHVAAMGISLLIGLAVFPFCNVFDKCVPAASRSRAFGLSFCPWLFSRFWRDWQPFSGFRS